MNLPNSNEFNFKDCIIAEDDCILITPKNMSAKWNDENSRFRSCIVRKSDNLVISQSLPKFKNWAEDPLFQPWNNSWKIEARHKKDGSTLICSTHKGEFIIRTRGTSNASIHETGNELDFLIEKYPKVFQSYPFLSGLYSIIFEHTTPNRIIVLREDDEPTLTLLAIIHNAEATLSSQSLCDDFAKEWNVPRPRKYIYSSVEECINDVKAWEGSEGVVLYSPNGNTLKKIKSDSYLELHKLCTGLTTTENVLDLFLGSERFTKYSDFYQYVETSLDHEIAEKIKDDISIVCVAYTKFLENLEQIEHIVEKFKGDSFSRKEQAIEIRRHWDGWRNTIAFQLLDGKEIEIKLIKNAILDLIKN